MTAGRASLAARLAGLMLVVGLLLPAAPARGQEEAEPPVVATGPGAKSVGSAAYVPAASVVGADRMLTYANVDLDRHDVVAVDAFREDGEWCDSFREKNRPCPLFWTPLLSLGEHARVAGLEDAVPGTVYVYKCSVHPGMRGRLIVAQ